MLASLLLAVIVGTWNGNWFPSGRAEHRTNEVVEAATIRATGKMLAKGLKAVDPEGTNDVILCLCEIRGPRVARELASAIGRTNLAVVAVSGYRKRDRFDPQQNVILSTLPSVQAGWCNWKRPRNFRMARGYAWADFVLTPAVTSRVYAVHLKSNYGNSNPKTRELNLAKRTEGAEQLAAAAKSLPSVVLAGDFNTDPDREEFADERTFPILFACGFSDTLRLLPVEKRGTHPNKTWGDSSLDHILLKGLQPAAPPYILPSSEGLSDHLPVFVHVTADRPDGNGAPVPAPQPSVDEK